MITTNHDLLPYFYQLQANMSYRTVVHQNQHAHVAMAGLAKTKGVMVNEMGDVEQINMHHKTFS